MAGSGKYEVMDLPQADCGKTNTLPVLSAVPFRESIAPKDQESRSGVQAADVSHYVSNTLVFILEFIKAAGSANKAGDEKRLGKNLSSIIDAVLDLQDYMTKFNHTQRNEAAHQEAISDCTAIVKNIVLDFAHHLESRNAVITIKGTLPHIIAEPTALDLVFRNLIINALQHSGRRDVKLVISGKVRGTESLICVSDNGKGFPGTSSNESFPADEYPDTRDVSERGQGLSYCKRTIEAWGGRLWIGSRSGEGARIFFSARTVPVGSASLS